MNKPLKLMDDKARVLKKDYDNALKLYETAKKEERHQRMIYENATATRESREKALILATQGLLEYLTEQKGRYIVR